MKNLSTPILKIEYTKDYEEEAKILRDVLNSNTLFFQALLSPTKIIRFTDEIDFECEDALEITGIEDLKKYLVDVVQEFIKKLNLSRGQDKDLNEVIFLKILLLDKLGKVGDYNPKFKDSSDLKPYINAIYALIASTYYTEPTDYIDSLFSMDDTEKSLLYQWLNERRRYDLLNHLLQKQYDLIITGNNQEKIYDPFMKEHINEIISIMQLNIIKGNIIIEEEKKKNTPELPKLSKEELDELLKEFLISIDPSLKWLKAYNDLKEKGLIKYSESKLEDQAKWLCASIDGKWHIIAPLTGTIRDFRCMIHELAHYISLLNDPKELQPPALKEYPSILFETLAINFLGTKGYSQEITDELLRERKIWTQDNVFDISPTLIYLKEYINDGPITFEKEKQKQIDLISSLPDNLPESLNSKLKELKEIDDEKIKYKCDLENAFILTYPTTIYDEYPYVMGNYFAIKTLERLNEEPLLIYEILDITENLKDVTPEEVIARLGLSTDEFSSSPKNPQYQKKQEN